MNNYIPLNKAVGPKVICDGYQALIPQKLGVDAMTFNFDGSECEHATCAGAPEMFIKVEEDGLYYFGVEADDTGSLTIAGEQAIKKDGTQPNIETDSRFLKAGYYKVALSYENNAYNPVRNNAAAFNVTMDREPIQAGKYEGNSTMKREFSPSPKIKLWTIEKESNITCEPSKKVELEFESPEPVYLEGHAACNVKSIRPKICVTVCKDEAENVWRCRVVSVSAGAELKVYQGSYIDPYFNPPLNEEEAIEAVNEMNGYQARGRVGTWHTTQASLAHEEHHRRQWEDAYNFYWKESKIQEMLEKETLSCDEEPDMNKAVKSMQSLANEMALDLWTETSTYVLALPDQANDRPYCAGQEVLNEATAHVIRLADAMGWSNVPRFITKPGTIEPPCFMPPVSEGETRSMAVAEEPFSLKLSIADTSRFAEGRITLCFRNEGNEPVRIPDEINEETSNFFFRDVVENGTGENARFEQGNRYHDLPAALELPGAFPGQEYGVTIPVCLDEVDLEGWKQCSCELETRYYNQQGKDCFLGMLRAMAKLML